MGKPAPCFWWDFEHGKNGELAVIVQSDYPGGDELARFDVPKKELFADSYILQAEKLIDDFKTGRKTPLWNKA